MKIWIVVARESDCNMKVKEFFEKINLGIMKNHKVLMHDMNSNTEREDSLITLLENKSLYKKWLNAQVLCWSIVDREFILTVSK